MEGHNKEMQQSNKTKQENKTKTKPPTPMGRSNGCSPHPAHCHMGRVSIQSKIVKTHVFVFSPAVA